MSNSVFSDYYLTSFLYNSSFINQHLLSDYNSKLSYLDTVLLGMGSSPLNSGNFLYSSFISDTFLLFNIKFLNVISLFSSSYQDILSLVLLFSPEVILAFNDYFLLYYSNSFLGATASSVFDSYTSNLNYSFGDGIITLFLFFIFSWFVIYFFTLSFFFKVVRFPINTVCPLLFIFFFYVKRYENTI
jgi:hypothetical protein